MIQEVYVSFETAKLLKKKGFDSPCMGRYSVRSREFHLDCTKRCNNGGLFECAAPSQAMAMKWLREVHNQHVQIKYFHGAYQEFEYVIINTFNGKAYHKPEGFFSYEEACEEGIKYCLENLI